MSDTRGPGETRLPIEKEKVVQQFRQWLESQDGYPEIANDKVPIEPQIDLYSLFAEFIALRSEIKIESRQFKNAFDRFQSVFDFLKSGYELLQKDQVAPQDRQAEIRQQVLAEIIPEILQVRDRIEDSLGVINLLKPKIIRKKRKFKQKRKLLVNIKEGQAMLLKRLDKLLHSIGVVPINSLGQSFDPHLMRVLAVVHEENNKNGIVVEEIRKGFLLNDKVLRLAEVKVNKVDAPAQDKEPE